MYLFADQLLWGLIPPPPSGADTVINKRGCWAIMRGAFLLQLGTKLQKPTVYYFSEFRKQHIKKRTLSVLENGLYAPYNFIDTFM